MAKVSQPMDIASTARHNIGQPLVSALTSTVIAVNSFADINHFLRIALITTLCTVSSPASGQPTDHPAVSFSFAGQPTSIAG